MKDKPFVKTFRVFSIKKLDVSKKARNANYVLRCYDPEYFNNITTKIQKSYSNMPVSEMVEKICQEFLQIKSDKIETDKTEGKPTLVIPNMAPDIAIRELLSRYAKSQKYPDISNYMFYSTQKGYKFKCLEDLIDKENRSSEYIIDKYTLREKDITIKSTAIELEERKKTIEKKVNEPLSSNELKDLLTPTRKPEAFLRISDFEIVNKMDLENAIMDGVLDNSLQIINPNISLYETKTYNYSKDFEKFKHTAISRGYKIVEDDTNYSSLKGKSKQYFLFSNKGERDIDQDKEDPRHSFYNKQRASFAMLNSVILNLTVPGDNTRQVGDLIELSLPEYGGTDDVLREVDKFISGYYLVTAVRNIYNTKQGYTTIMRCMKNCFEKSIDDVITQNTEKVVPNNSTKPQENIPAIVKEFDA
jgi:hypothetical protein